MKCIILSIISCYREQIYAFKYCDIKGCGGRWQVYGIFLLILDFHLTFARIYILKQIPILVPDKNIQGTN